MDQPHDHPPALPVGQLGDSTPYDYQHHAALPLTRENYKKKFTALVYLEEEVHNKLLKDK